MALTYTLSGNAFADSLFGTATASTALKTLVPQVVDRRYHKTVLDKSFFTRAGIVGPDSYTEGGVMGTAPGFPVVRKTELNAQPGDVIKMGLLRKLTANYLTGGKVANLQLVDNETVYDFYSLKVSIERWRQGVYGFGGMSVQRNPYATPLKGIQQEVLADWTAEMQDTALLYALFTGWSPHLMRAHGVTNCHPTWNPNTLYGNDVTLTTTRTVADLSGAGDDNVFIFKIRLF